MLNTSVQRDGERVTAEEIRYMARELEDALGGVYSVLSKELQLPVVTVFMAQMVRQKKLPVLPEGKVKLVIVTGLEALGRSHELVKLNTWLSEISVLGPEIVAPYINVSEFIARVSLATGVNEQGLVKSEEEVAQAQQQAQQQQMQKELTSDVIKSGAASNLIKGAVDSGQGLQGIPGMPAGMPQGAPAAGPQGS
jgi:hypothetical protein